MVSGMPFHSGLVAAEAADRLLPEGWAEDEVPVVMAVEVVVVAAVAEAEAVAGALPCLSVAVRRAVPTARPEAGVPAVGARQVARAACLNPAPSVAVPVKAA